MDRRNLSKALLASAAGSTLLVDSARAQTCSPPCYAITSYENSAGVLPTDLEYTPHPYDVRRNGALGNASTDDTFAFSQANAAAGSIFIPRGTYRIAANITISRNVIFEHGAVLKPDANVTITLNGAVTAGPYRIFNLANGNSKIAGAFGGVEFIPQWWGVVADGNFVTPISGTDNAAPLQACIDACSQAGGGTVRNSPGIYRLNSQVVIPDGITFVGPGRWSCIFFYPGSAPSIAGVLRIAGTTGYPTVVKGISVVGETGGANGSGIVSTKNGVMISDVWVSAFTSNAGIILSSTDNFLHDFAVEMCLTGIQVTQAHVNISNGTTYANLAAGILVTNGAAVEHGRVTISDVRSSADGQNGIVISGGKRVSIIGCSCTHTDASRYSVAGIEIDSANDVTIEGFSGVLGVTSTTARGIYTHSSTNVTISGSSCSRWRDGVELSNSSGITVTGGIYGGNGRRGIFVSGGDLIVITGSSCHSNGSTESGIHSDNVGATANHLISGNMCNGQRYGISAYVGGSGAYTNLVGNMCRNNTSAPRNLTGSLAHINDVGNF
jgi:parallel beta-helix repeat protein